VHRFVSNRECPIFEIYTSEMVDALAKYVRRRLAELGESHPHARARPCTLLEVGAADGRLSHYLNAKLPDGVRVVATDLNPRPTMRVSIQKSADGPPEIPEDQECQVEQLSVEEALKTHTPVMVLVSWMPAGRDWTAQFRKCHTCLEYLLVGPTHGSSSGHDWFTWGQGGLDSEVAPHTADGWSRHNVAAVARWQLSRVDLSYFATDGIEENDEERSQSFTPNSATVAFRRGAPQAVVPVS
jgi:hypothetical protein